MVYTLTIQLFRVQLEITFLRESFVETTEISLVISLVISSDLTMVEEGSETDRWFSSHLKLVEDESDAERLFSSDLTMVEDDTVDVRVLLL